MCGGFKDDEEDICLLIKINVLMCINNSAVLGGLKYL